MVYLLISRILIHIALTAILAAARWPLMQIWICRHPIFVLIIGVAVIALVLLLSIEGELMMSTDMPRWLLPVLIVIAVGSIYIAEVNPETKSRLGSDGYLQNLAASLTGFAIGGIAAALVFERAKAQARRRRWQIVEQVVTYSIYGHIAAVGEVIAQAYIAPRDEWMVGRQPPRELTQLLSLGIEGPSAADMGVWSSTRGKLALQMSDALFLRNEVVPILRSALNKPGDTLWYPEGYSPHELFDALSQALYHTSEHALQPMVEVEPHLEQLREVLIPRIADLTDDDKLVQLFEQFNYFSYLWDVALRGTPGTHQRRRRAETLAATRDQVAQWMDIVNQSPRFFRPNQEQVEAIAFVAVTYGFQVGTAGLLFDRAGTLYFYLLRQLGKVGDEDWQHWTMFDIETLGHQLLPDHMPSNSDSNIETT